MSASCNVVKHFLTRAQDLFPTLEFDLALTTLTNRILAKFLKQSTCALSMASYCSGSLKDLPVCKPAIAVQRMTGHTKNWSWPTVRSSTDV